MINTARNTLAVLLTGISIVVHSAGAADVNSGRCMREVNGKCLECQYGWYGPQCLSQCRFCFAGCDQSGICAQCESGSLGKYCNTSCPDHCRPNRGGRVNCERDTGRCQEGCEYGWWGDTCNQPCSTHCMKGACLQINGDCVGECQDGWCGVQCNTRCPPGCVHAKCSFLGKCLDGCSAGLWGEKCDKLCSQANAKCFQSNGTSTGECKDGWHGLKCDTMCSVGCLTGTCDRRSGICKGGCKVGVYGDKCEHECSSQCKEFMCDNNGRCVRGCNTGFRGSSCHVTCPANCLTCEQDADLCTRCKIGWNGRLCQSTQPYSSGGRYIRIDTILMEACALMSLISGVVLENRLSYH